MATSLQSMFTRVLSSSVRIRFNHVKSRAAFSTSRCSYTQDSSENGAAAPSSLASERDPFPVFSDPEVQSLLIRVTGFDLLKLAGPQIKPLQKPSYLLLTDQELAEKQAEAKERLKYRLQMPPFMNPRKPFTEPLAVDPELAGHDTSKYVFADISFGIKDRKRHVVIRMPDGSLLNAPWDLRDRMNQIYNPMEGRNVIKPAMFQEKNLERMLAEGRYLYILDRACCQFEPDDPDYIRTTRRVYNAIDKAKAYEVLRSTRHFGPLTFYLAWNRMIDSLLLDMINRDLEDNAQDLVKLYCLLHQDGACAQTVASLSQGAEPVEVITAYIDSEAKQKEQLQLALQALEDVKRSKENRSGEQRS